MEWLWILCGFAALAVVFLFFFFRLTSHERRASVQAEVSREKVSEEREAMAAQRQSELAAAHAARQKVAAALEAAGFGAFMGAGAGLTGLPPPHWTPAKNLIPSRPWTRREAFQFLPGMRLVVSLQDETAADPVSDRPASLCIQRLPWARVRIRPYVAPPYRLPHPMPMVAFGRHRLDHDTLYIGMDERAIVCILADSENAPPQIPISFPEDDWLNNI